MGIFSFLSSKKKKAETSAKPSVVVLTEGSYRHVATYDYNGEKNHGEAGPLIDYRLQYNELRIRSWQAMLESDTAQIGINRLITWVIGKGLKPQANPMDHILKNEGIKLPKDKFGADVEHSFNLYRRSRRADHSGMMNLDELSEVAEKHAIVGGDVLVILRVIDGDRMTVQLIDGWHVQSPEYGSEWWPKMLPNGHKIADGVEMDAKGRHIAYHVRVSAVNGGDPVNDYRFERIEAYGPKSGMLMAFLYYGSKHRLGNVRGIPLISSVIEKCKKIEQYVDSALNQAKHAAELSYQVVHHKDAEGKNPMLNSVVAGFDVDAGRNLPVTDDGTQLATNLQVTLGNSAFNVPPGGEIKTIENKNPLYFKEFYETNADAVFAVLGIPPNVAMSKYNDSFSASRAAIKDWEHTLVVKRERHHIGFLQPIYELWLYLEILNNRIQAPGYLQARFSKNYRILDAYHNIRFLGANVPHIDPVKEVTAARLKLGAAGAAMPLDDLESLTESLGGGDSKENIRQFSEELKSCKSAGIEAPQPAKATDKKPPRKKKD